MHPIFTHENIGILALVAGFDVWMILMHIATNGRQS
jgi:hypothetical protein